MTIPPDGRMERKLRLHLSWIETIKFSESLRELPFQIQGALAPALR
ncbi:MAG: hypothetical protein JWN70_697 [Planctomycetaceae bacterium]|nr:hypothetical protein [Planctomycetaceae bacterium]